jgi:hypothetical protein
MGKHKSEPELERHAIWIACIARRGSAMRETLVVRIT